MKKILKSGSRILNKKITPVKTELMTVKINFLKRIEIENPVLEFVGFALLPLRRGEKERGL
jgi:hypothetical protein